MYSVAGRLCFLANRGLRNFRGCKKICLLPLFDARGSDCSRCSPGGRAGEMIPEVEGTRPWGPPRKKVPKCLKGPKTTYTTNAIAEKQAKRVKRAHFRYILGPPVPPKKWNLWGPEGKVPPSPSPPPPVSPAMPGARWRRSCSWCNVLLITLSESFILAALS